MRQVLVLGAGVNGLSSALNIQDSCRDVRVTVMAEKFSPNTTSDGSAGYWTPSTTGNTNRDLILALSKETYEYMRDLATSPSASITGTLRTMAYQLYGYQMEEGDSYYKDCVDEYRRLTPYQASRMFSKAKDGFCFAAYTMNVTKYLKWLTDRFLSNGGCIVQRKVNSLNELSSDWDVIVNCVGIGAYELLQDKTVYPTRGQVFRVRAPWLKQCLLYKNTKSGTITYILPNSDTVVVGGTHQKGDWNRTLDKEDTRDIWDRAVKFMPSLKNAEIVREWVGLRPTRDSLRLETEIMELGEEKRKQFVVHNYGHGGAGITMHWGCAKRTTDMVAKFLNELDKSDSIRGSKRHFPSKL